MGLNRQWLVRGQPGAPAFRIVKWYFQKRFQAVSGTNRLGLCMIKCTQIAQRLKKIRCEDQDEEACKQLMPVP